MNTSIIDENSFITPKISSTLSRPKENLHAKYHKRIVRMMNFLIDDLFGEEGIWKGNKELSIQTTMHFNKNHDEVVQDVLEHLKYLGAISQWDFQYRWNSSDEFVDDSLIMKSDPVVTTTSFVSYNIKMSYSENASADWENVKELTEEINDIIDNVPLGSIDLNTYDQTKKLFKMDDTDLRTRYDEKKNEISPEGPLSTSPSYEDVLFSDKNVGIPTNV